MQRYGKRLLEMLSQCSGLGSAANLDDLAREGLEEDLEEMIAEAHEGIDVKRSPLRILRHPFRHRVRNDHQGGVSQRTAVRS